MPKYYKLETVIESEQELDVIESNVAWALDVAEGVTKATIIQFYELEDVRPK